MGNYAQRIQNQATFHKDKAKTDMFIGQAKSRHHVVHHFFFVYPFKGYFGLLSGGLLQLCVFFISIHVK